MTAWNDRRTATLVAVLTWMALALQLVLTYRLSLDRGFDLGHALLVFFGYFTILSNLFIAGLSTAHACAGKRTRGHGLRSDALLGCAITAIIVVGLGYHLLLRHVWSPEGAQWWADMALHYAVPIASFLWWAFRTPAQKLPLTLVFVWAMYPVIYFVYAMIRGQLTGLYPYPFVDVPALGYSRVLVNASGLLIAFTIVGVGVIVLSRWRTPNATMRS